MTAINKLTSNPATRDSDLIPIWDSENNRTRNISVKVLSEFINSGSSTPSEDKYVISGIYRDGSLTLNYNNGGGFTVQGFAFKSTDLQDMPSFLTPGSSLRVNQSGTMYEFFTPGDTSLNNRIVVTSAAQLSGPLDSTKEYFIDGVVDMGTQSIEVPVGGLYLSGYNFDTSKLISSATGYTMFTSPVGGSGNIIGKDYAIEVTGSTSQVYNLTSATGFDAFEFSRINYNNCESLGEINGYRQGFESGTGRFGGKPQLTLSGTWVGGYFIDASIVRSLTDGAYSLFAAGAGFSMASRFRSNMNLDLPASASYFDFSPSQFVNPSTVEITDGIVTRNGAFDATDSNYTPNMQAGDLSSSWKGNNGMPNTFEGGSVGVTTSSLTTINTIGVFEDITAATWTTADLQHFDSPSPGQLRHIGNTPREYKVVASFAVDSTANDELTLRVAKWDSSASTFVTVLDQARQVNNLLGGRDVAFFNININTTLDQNDYIKLQVANNTSNDNVTAEVDSYFVVEER